MVLYDYVCVYAFLLHRESPDRILGDKPLLFQGGSVTDGVMSEEEHRSSLTSTVGVGRPQGGASRRSVPTTAFFIGVGHNR
jgi:hypothetical protein